MAHQSPAPWEGQMADDNDLVQQYIEADADFLGKVRSWLADHRVNYQQYEGERDDYIASHNVTFLLLYDFLMQDRDHPRRPRPTIEANAKLIIEICDEVDGWYRSLGVGPDDSGDAGMCVEYAARIKSFVLSG